jgi:hypothetical protein
MIQDIQKHIIVLKTRFDGAPWEKLVILTIFIKIKTQQNGIF